MQQEKLKEEGIYHPIKLEYYKIVNEDEIVKNEDAKYGIKVVKTEYKENKTSVEHKKIQHISSDENKIDKILNLFKQNEVTPVIVEDVLSDFSKIW